MKINKHNISLDIFPTESHFQLGTAPTKNSFGKMSDHYFRDHRGAKKIVISTDQI